MPLSLSTSLTSSLNTLTQKVLVIDRSGIILFINDHYNAYLEHCGLPPAIMMTGSHYLELFEEWIAIPVQLTALDNALQHVLQGGVLISSSEFILHIPDKSDHVFSLDAFPLFTERSCGIQLLLLTLHDKGPAEPRQHDHVRSCHPLRPRRIAGSLVPICASCKSVRGNKEEWITVERFLQLQLSLQFTHDICPDCIRQLYPQYAGVLNQ
ncbi:hypothetical protein R70723_05750 [Paenibacillus sp. FSL R7-0273]|uniref:PAS domain-containing protein n=1 Tax=Paenibacillus sp. FSL R7-0273 TaxID=1536772 RepID=UPI0004F8E8F1|nr:PAS domain-containing protein [Paenibacillus sp. FSL R7-0273]AIQ45452.1 hypothetical protein R70723_05750 [Paenibacillus sp. FSL R7-0273]OMF89173.1 hypothetical protein BK144_20430 [Paenibacillus sp. FSL R7-0273]